MKVDEIVIVNRPSANLLEGQCVKVHKVMGDGRVQVDLGSAITTVQASDIELFIMDD